MDSRLAILNHLIQRVTLFTHVRAYTIAKKRKKKTKRHHPNLWSCQFSWCSCHITFAELIKQWNRIPFGFLANPFASTVPYCVGFILLSRAAIKLFRFYFYFFREMFWKRNVLFESFYWFLIGMVINQQRKLGNSVSMWAEYLLPTKLIEFQFRFDGDIEMFSQSTRSVCGRFRVCQKICLHHRFWFTESKTVGRGHVGWRYVPIDFYEWIDDMGITKNRMYSFDYVFEWKTKAELELPLKLVITVWWWRYNDRWRLSYYARFVMENLCLAADTVSSTN